MFFCTNPTRDGLTFFLICFRLLGLVLANLTKWICICCALLPILVNLFLSLSILTSIWTIFCLCLVVQQLVCCSDVCYKGLHILASQVIYAQGCNTFKKTNILFAFFISLISNIWLEKSLIYDLILIVCLRVNN